MIGRAAQGAPWIFREVNAYIAHGEIRSATLAHAERQRSFFITSNPCTSSTASTPGFEWRVSISAGIAGNIPIAIELRHALMAAEDSASQYAAARAASGIGQSSRRPERHDARPEDDREAEPAHGQEQSRQDT